MVDFSKEQLQKIVEYSKEGYSEQVIANKLGVSKFDLEAFLTSAAEEHTRNSKTVEAITFREYLKFRDDDRLEVLGQLKKMGTGYWMFPPVDEFDPEVANYPPQYIKPNNVALKDYLTIVYP